MYENTGNGLGLADISDAEEQKKHSMKLSTFWLLMVIDAGIYLLMALYCDKVQQFVHPTAPDNQTAQGNFNVVSLLIVSV